MLIALTTDPGLSSADLKEEGVTESFQPKQAPSVKDTLLNIVPSNPIAAMADGQMLQVILFALLLGLALSKAGDSGTRLRSIFADLNEVMMRLITMIIALTPVGVFCLMTQLGATLGLAEIAKVGMYFVTLVFALLIHGIIVYPTLLKSFAGLSPRVFLAKMREPLLVAFSTSSSGATLPVTLRTVEYKLGVSNNVASFAVPLGATINMDGTCHHAGRGHGIYCAVLWHRPNSQCLAHGSAYGDSSLYWHRSGSRCWVDHPDLGAGSGGFAGRGYSFDHRCGSLARYAANCGERYR
jgi:Na+/H+-dicarboxylate symporter